MPDAPSDAQGRELLKLQLMLACAIARGGQLTLTNEFKARPRMRDLVKMERSINQWLRETLRHYFKLKPAQIPRFYMDVMQASRIDDGDDKTVRVTLDFAKLLPCERAPEVVAACERIMAQFEETEDAPTPTPDPSPDSDPNP